VGATSPDNANSDTIGADVVKWVAELWIDPDWYSTQGALENMPSPGVPDIIGLSGPTALIGRAAPSRGISPEIDCGLDIGVSRRHAELITDGTRWWIEDLQSANGTFVAGATGALPAMPIPPGKIELRQGQRVYVGAWTKLVLRPATVEEAAAFDTFAEDSVKQASNAPSVPDVSDNPESSGLTTPAAPDSPSDAEQLPADESPSAPEINYLEPAEIPAPNTD
jgi:hypothetical protein